MAVEYIHYGHKKFQINRFFHIRNQKLRNKPFGGLWASRTDAKYGWKEWNEDEQFRECEEENSFKFTLSTNANVLEIHSHKDLSKVPEVKKAMKLVEEILSDPKEREIIDAREIARLNYNSGMAEAEKNGIEKRNSRRKAKK